MLIANYITSAWRNILRHKLFSIINILGLAIGLAAVMLIALYVRYETSYDSFWKNSDNIYRMQMTISMPGRDPVNAAYAPLLAAPALKQDFPEVIHTARGFPLEASFIQGSNIKREDVTFVDPEILKIFDLEIVAGDLNASLNDNLSLILNETLALKYFGAKNPIGETITLKLFAFEKDYKVGAIIKDMPANSHVEFTAMLGLFENDWADDPFVFKSWLRPYVRTFFTVKSGTDIELINQQMDAFIDRHYPHALSGDPDTKPSEEISLSSLNIKDVHLNASGFGDRIPFGDAATVFTFAVVAVLILLIASINFMNLSTARATKRAKEVSLRKVMGAARNQLIIQFIGESVALTLISLVLGLAIVEIYLPYFQDMVGIPLVVNYGSGDLAMIFALAIIVGVFGGTYPAFVLSSFRPVENLKSSKSAETKTTINFRTSLVIFQFTISIILFVATAIIYSQMRYADNFDFGFDKENTLAVRNIKIDEVAASLDVLLAEFSKIPNITSVTTSSALPGVEMVNSSNVRAPDMTAGDAIVIDTRTVGYDFFKTFGIEIQNGRTFARDRNDLLADRGEEISSLIINELAARELGFSSAEDAIGKRVSGVISLDGDLSQNYQIIGVTSNFHFGTLKDEVLSAMYILNPKSNFAIGLSFSGNQQLIIDKLQNVWTNLFPDIPFNFTFSSDAIAQKYTAEKSQMTMFAAFSSLAIFIACLGLFGLESFTAERRTKEIGIRKVFGAEVLQIVKLLVWQFSKPVLIANIIAWPLAYLAMSRWLKSFVYRIDDMVIIALCLIAGLTALLIAWATVAGNSYTVARQNPIKALKYE